MCKLISRNLNTNLSKLKDFFSRRFKCLKHLVFFLLTDSVLCLVLRERPCFCKKKIVLDDTENLMTLKNLYILSFIFHINAIHLNST